MSTQHKTKKSNPPEQVELVSKKVKVESKDEVQQVEQKKEIEQPKPEAKFKIVKKNRVKDDEPKTEKKVSTKKSLSQLWTEALDMQKKRGFVTQQHKLSSDDILLASTALVKYIYTDEKIRDDICILDPIFYPDERTILDTKVHEKFSRARKMIILPVYNSLTLHWSLLLFVKDGGVISDIHHYDSIQRQTSCGGDTVISPLNDYQARSRVKMLQNFGVIPSYVQMKNSFFWRQTYDWECGYFVLVIMTLILLEDGVVDEEIISNCKNTYLVISNTFEHAIFKDLEMERCE